jgi:hypothetical protein
MHDALLLIALPDQSAHVYLLVVEEAVHQIPAELPWISLGSHLLFLG